MDAAAALSLKVDSSDVVKATADLDKFSAASTRAASASSKAGSGSSGSIAKLVAEVQSANSKLMMIVGTLEKLASVDKAAAAANDNVARSFVAADAHVTAYRTHLEALAKAQQGAAASAVQHQTALQAVKPAMAQADAHVLAYRASLKQVEVGAEGARKAITFTAHDSLNAMRQLSDIGTTAAMGMNPLMIAIQQGPQLLDILQNKAAQTGQTLGSVFRAAGASIWAAMVPLLPIILPIIAALALATAGIAALTRQANDDSGLKKYTTAMGYTKEEVKKLNGVTVTWGDTTKAVFQVALRSAAEALGLNTKTMAKTWDTFLDRLASGTRATLAGIYAGLAGTKAYLGEIEKGGLTGIGKMLIGKGDPDLLKKTYGKAYADGQKALDAIANQARTNARERQDKMAKEFYDKPSTPKGPKPFTYADLMKDADKTRNDLTKQAAEIGKYGEALAKVTYEQDLLNKASEHGLKLSPAQRSAIAGIAAELAKLSEANRTAKFMEDFQQGTTQQLAALEQQRGAIGLTAGALAEYTYKQEALNRAIAQHTILTAADKQKISDDAARIGQATTTNITEGAQDAGYRGHNERMRQLEAERDALGLTGQALISYNYQQAEITRQLQAGVQFADLNVETIRRQGDAYARVRDEIDRQAKAIQDSREITQSFFRDWIDGVRQGEGVFQSFGKSILNMFNRIIDKIIEAAIEQLFFNSIAGGGGAEGAIASTLIKVVGSLFANGGAFGTAQQFAKGGAFGTVHRFATGGAFTNQIVNTPTLFKFANGGKTGLMGEAGPEAILPLARDSNGKLGVQASGGAGKRTGDINITNQFAVGNGYTPDMVMQAIRQGGEATFAEVRRQLQSMLNQLDQDGVLH